MSLWNSFKSWFSKPLDTDCCAPTPVEVEKEPCGDLFAEICRDVGVKQHWLESTNAIVLFEEWYTGSRNQEEIKASINDFVDANPFLRAKLQGKFQNDIGEDPMMAKAQAFIDGWLAKLTSRKLMVWVTATALTFTGHVTSDDWVIISAIYIGGQTIIDGIARLKGYND